MDDSLLASSAPRVATRAQGGVMMEKLIVRLKDEIRKNKIRNLLILFALFLICCLLALDSVVILSHWIHFGSKPGRVTVDTPGFLTIVETIPDEVELTTAIQTWEAWVELIDSAVTNLDIACFYMTLHNTTERPGQANGEAVFQALLRALDRGVVVRVAASMPNGPSYEIDYNLLRNAGAEVVYVDFHNLYNGVLHTKFIIADHERAYLGSANMDWRSLQQVKELGVIVYSPTLAKDLGTIHEIYWETGVRNATATLKHLDTRMSLETPGSLNLNHTTSDVFLTVSPPPMVSTHRTGDADAMVATILDAKKTVCINVMDYAPVISGFGSAPNVYWPVIEDAIRRVSALQTGAYPTVGVRLMVSFWNNTNPIVFEAAATLAMYQNIEVRMFHIPDLKEPLPFPTDHTRVNHAKYMVTDRKAVVTTSNWEANYFIDTAGVSLVTDNPELRAGLQAVFDRDWDSEFAYTVPEVMEKFVVGGWTVDFANMTYPNSNNYRTH
ncbi:PLD-like domain [Carpediemonas membranifera]|uniref:PLD-like domain n=1 Tax=Carpediemonas membranifera TaxID=201153 RepID=A0A8J6EBF9_9EUKA|nr:PLD-like domain [Carpediemonas membranifera]|eukprot:KAG9397090.1 PLD-like domain [Carpediemonas membranifera]